MCCLFVFSSKKRLETLKGGKQRWTLHITRVLDTMLAMGLSHSVSKMVRVSVKFSEFALLPLSYSQIVNPSLRIFLGNLCRRVWTSGIKFIPHSKTDCSNFQTTDVAKHLVELN